ncbi:TPA: hypothetical protein SLG40_003217 [Serratia odorifera]|nr:hypothetical protein [Serratia odorifera]
MKKIILLAALGLNGCVCVYGPTKSGNVPQPGESTSPVVAPVDAATLVGNRRPDELFSKAEAWFASKGITPIVSNEQSGIIATIGDTPALADSYLDCSVLGQSQPLQRQYRLVVQTYSAGEGSRVSAQASGTARLTAADGNDKVKPAECRSNGNFEKDMLEVLRK